MTSAEAYVAAPPTHPDWESTTPTANRPSPFFHTSPTTEADDLAILHLKRESLLPLTLRSTADDGYAEGAVTNTRFGSFPHSTLIGLEWGSQVRASRVDTGSRGRKGKHAKRKDSSAAEEAAEGAGDRKKRKSDTVGDHAGRETKRLKQAPAEVVNGEEGVRIPTDAGSGFVHVLPPTPEGWTSSLDHRTQVVYTPDYSYILQRLRVRPGDTVIEAGAGSGSFTHAAARAVFNGYPGVDTEAGDEDSVGKVYSFEYHEPRVQTLQLELRDHGLDSFVYVTHRDVCNDGFSLQDQSAPISANAVFLDLPAPHIALPHLVRGMQRSILNLNTPIHLCTFSPCIEQVIATTNYLRRSGWIEIQMVEVQHRRLDVRREHTSLHFEGLRGVNASAGSVDEAIGKLREVEANLSAFHSSKPDAENRNLEKAEKTKGRGGKVESKQERLKRMKEEVESRKMWKEGNLVVRSEPEVKTHTSYLVFAVLPREWTEEDEAKQLEKWSVDEFMATPPEVRVAHERGGNHERTKDSGKKNT